jgi:hypothetical protein
VRELARLHGGELSAGVCMLIVDAADLRADARYIAARARADNDPDLSRTAATLLESARQSERDAWELASREAKVRPPTAADYPWLRSADDDAAPWSPSTPAKSPTDDPPAPEEDP